MVQVGTNSFDDDGTVSATALYLLKSLKEDKIMAQQPNQINQPELLRPCLAAVLQMQKNRIAETLLTDYNKAARLLLEQVQLHKQFLDLAAYLFVLRLEKPALEQQFLIGSPVSRTGGGGDVGRLGHGGIPAEPGETAHPGGELLRLELPPSQGQGSLHAHPDLEGGGIDRAIVSCFCQENELVEEQLEPGLRASLYRQGGDARAQAHAQCHDLIRRGGHMGSAAKDASRPGGGAVRRGDLYL